MRKDNKTIIIFGATGAVGAYTTIHLLNKGFNVIAVGKRTSDNGFFSDFDCIYISIDIEKKSDFNKLPLNNVAGIVHLAGYLPAIMEGYNPQRYIDININGTLNILDYAAKVKVDFFVYSTSFSDVSYLWNKIEPISSDAEIRFPLNNDHSIYSITKNTGADLVRHYSAKFGFSHFVLRFPNIYLYHPNIYYHVDGVARKKGLFNVIDEAERGIDIELWGSPNRFRDMVYVKDCCQIIEKCITHENMGGTYNVGTGIGVTREEQIKGIIDVFSPESKRSNIVYRPENPDSPQYIMDISKTIENLDYHPKYLYKDSLIDLKIERITNRFEKLWGSEEDYIIQ